jgi:hypothetical protein
LYRYQDGCCTASTTPSGAPDFSSLSIQPNFGCNSLTAPFILSALCEGKSDCTIPLDPSHIFTIPVDGITAKLPSDWPLHLTALCQSLFISNKIQYCNTTLQYGGSFDECGGNVGQNGVNGVNGYTYKNGILRNNLLFEAVCITELVQLGSVTSKTYFSTNQLLFIAAMLDGLSIFVFFLGVSWIRFQIEKETLSSDLDQCTASDYTIACLTMPNTKKDESSVKEILHHHFETVLNENRKLPQNRITNMREEEIKIADINCSTCCSAYLSAAVERGSAANLVDRIISKIRTTVSGERVRQSIIMINRDTGVDPHSLKSVKSTVIMALKIALFKFEYYNDKCLALSEEAKGNIHSAFITFENEYSYVSCLKQIPNIGIFTRIIQDKKYNIEGQTMFITVRFHRFLSISVLFNFLFFPFLIIVFLAIKYKIDM